MTKLALQSDCRRTFRNQKTDLFSRVPISTGLSETRLKGMPSALSVRSIISDSFCPSRMALAAAELI